jgi:hypothetical protein
MRFIGSLCAIVACLTSTTVLSGGQANPTLALPSTAVEPGAPARASLADVPVDEMLHTARGRWERWTQVPELVVLTSVMDFHARGAREYRATDERLREKDVDALVTDLTRALRELSGEIVVQFAAVHRQTIAAGESVAIMQPGKIVAGRYRGVREVENTLGFGGRQTRTDGSIAAGAVVLDAEFDRTSRARALSRRHELGHALGFNHVTSRVSVMNAHIGPEPTNIDRQLARLAFARALRGE